MTNVLAEKKLLIFVKEGLDTMTNVLAEKKLSIICYYRVKITTF